MEGHLVHGIAIFVHFLEGAPGAGSFDIPEFIEDIVQDKSGYIAAGEFLFPAAHENPIDLGKLDDLDGKDDSVRTVSYGMNSCL